jgi:hypothetical protein
MHHPTLKRLWETWASHQTHEGLGFRETWASHQTHEDFQFSSAWGTPNPYITRPLNSSAAKAGGGGRTDLIAQSRDWS